MQYFLGYSSFTTEPPFDASLFVEFRKRLGLDNLNAINDKIVALKTHLEISKNESKPSNPDKGPTDNNSGNENRGRVIFDATACPQDIAYPTDLNLLSDARAKSEQLIDKLYDPTLHKRKPRTYRKIARKYYLHTAQKKNKSRKIIRKPLGRPSAVQQHVSPGERNPIEGKFGQAKTAYGLDRIRARLRNTSESWIACIFLVLNLVKLARVAPLCLLSEMLKSFSAKATVKLILRDVEEIYAQITSPMLKMNSHRDALVLLC